MRISTRPAAFAAIFAFLGQVDGFWRMSCGIIQTGRVDPVISFGTVSNHVHKISGASSISINSTYNSLVASNCTSCTIQADKSAYWTPALYYQHANGQFEEVPNSGTVVYYLGRGTDPYGNPIAQPFPPGLRMLSGNNFARTQDLTTMTWGNSSYPSRLVSERVSMVCINYEDETGQQTLNITNTNCPDGFRAQIQMQSCWDGVNLASSDQSHVAYLSQIDNGICPPTHPILLPHLFYEVFYSITGFYGGDGKFVFGNGDETGFAFHGDFMNGWDIPTLTDAIKQCLIGNPDGAVEECPVFSASNIGNSSQVCPEKSPIYPCEPVHGIITSLPGCITPTGYGAIVTAASVTCPGGNSAACAPNYSDSAPAPFSGSSAYNYLGCYTEATNSRALTDKSFINTTGMTGQACMAFCGTSTYAGVEYGQECYCGSALQGGSVAAPESDCGMVCTGDRWQTCGAGNRLNVYQLKGSKSASPQTTQSTANSTSSGLSYSTNYPSPPHIIVNNGSSAWTFLGCYTDSTSARALNLRYEYGSFNGSPPMSLEMCASFCAGATYFGVEYGQECYCGMTFDNGNVRVPTQDDCDTPCPGMAGEWCGSGGRMNLYSAIPSTTVVSPSSTAVIIHSSTTSIPHSSAASISKSVTATIPHSSTLVTTHSLTAVATHSSKIVTTHSLTPVTTHGSTLATSHSSTAKTTSSLRRRRSAEASDFN